jgi:hypothetical protein
MNCGWTLTNEDGTQRLSRNVGMELPLRCVISQKTADLNISLLPNTKTFTLNWFPGEKVCGNLYYTISLLFPSEFVFLFGFHIDFMDMRLAALRLKCSGTNASNISALLAKKIRNTRKYSSLILLREMCRVYLKSLIKFQQSGASILGLDAGQN